jgi:hypothetical protein
LSASKDLSVAINAYLPRNLSYDDDVEKAFLGLAGLFTSRLGEFHHGLPMEIFVKALLWTPENHLHESVGDHFMLKRRPGFPSWSWLGWEFGKFWTTTTIVFRFGSLINPHSLFYPLIYIWGFNASMDTIRLSDHEFEEEGLEECIPEILEHDEKSSWYRFHQFQHSKDVLPPLIPENAIGILPHLLIFWASCAVFNVSFVPISRPSKHGFATYTAECGRNKYNSFSHNSTVKSTPDHTVTLEVAWRQKMPQSLEVIAVAADGGGWLHTILIERCDGLAYRVNALDSLIHAEYWIEAQPERKLIVLA